MATLAEVQAKLRADAEARAAAVGGENRPKRATTGDNASYPFWNTPVGKTSTLRFISDGDENNVLPWVNRQTIKLTFDGVVGGERPTSNLVEITVPCVDMFKVQFPDEFKLGCPIQNHTRSWWPKKGQPDLPNTHLARKYWKKQSWIMQGFVPSSAFEEENAPENPIRRFMLGKKIFDKVYNAITGTDFEDMPTDPVAGCDFNIMKTMLGTQNNYDNSGWARRSRSLSAEEMAAIETYGPFTLRDYLGKMPDADGVAMIYAMFLDSLAGKPFDFASYGEAYKPYGVRNDNGGGFGAGRDENRDATDGGDVGSGGGSVGHSDASEPAGETGTPGRSKATDELLARIRNRQG